MSSATSIHPSANGIVTQPDTTQPSSENNNTGTAHDDSTTNGVDAPSDMGSDGYPEQKHAGRIGYGPQYNQAAGFSDKITGLKEEIKGKITKNPSLVEQGHERKTGELKHKQTEQDDNDSFATPDEKKAKSEELAIGDKEQAATVAPEGTQAAHDKSNGETVDKKHI